jgi:DNA-binding IclR family transcriptional regulator
MLSDSTIFVVGHRPAENMGEQAKQYERVVETVAAALDILECIVEEPALSLKRLSELTGLTPNRTMRLAGTLMSRGYLIRDAEHKRFYLGPRVMPLCRTFEQGMTIIATARPILRRLSRETGELSLLEIRDGLERVILLKEEGRHEIRYTVAEGHRISLHVGAAGKVLLAFGPDELQERVLSRRKLEKIGPGAITNPNRLREELELIRSNGYAESEGERIGEAAAVAVPVFDSTNNVVAALAIGGPKNRMNKKARMDHLGTLKEGARELSISQGWLEK